MIPVVVRGGNTIARVVKKIMTRVTLFPVFMNEAGNSHPITNDEGKSWGVTN